MDDKVWINSWVSAQVVDKAGRVKRRPPPGKGLLWSLERSAAGRGFKKLSGSRKAVEPPLEGRFSHVVTMGWHGLLDDALDNKGQCIQVGSGGGEGKDPLYRGGLRCRRAAGMRGMDGGYPDWDWNWEWDTQAERGSVSYAAVFPAGTVEGGYIDEVCVCAGWEPESACLVYGRLAEGVHLRRGDMLRIQMELTYAAVRCVL